MQKESRNNASIGQRTKWTFKIGYESVAENYVHFETEGRAAIFEAIETAKKMWPNAECHLYRGRLSFL